MGLMVMMSVGINMPTLEMHLISYGLEEKFVGFWYLIYTAAYLVSSAIMMKITDYDKKKVMVFGVCLFALAFFLLGPCPGLFERNLVVVGIGYHIMGWACSIQYSKK
jgi:MFS family permease